MKVSIRVGLSLVLGLVFAFLFYEQGFGVNLLIYDMAMAGLTAWIYRRRLQKIEGVVLFSGFVLSALAVFFIHTSYSIWVHLLAALLWMGFAQARELKNSLNWYIDGLANFFVHQFHFVNNINKVASSGKFGHIVKWIWVIIPAIIIGLVFVGIYYNASPWMEDLVDKVQGRVIQQIIDFFSDLNVLFIFLFLLGLMISNYFLLGSQVELSAAKGLHDLKRIRERPAFAIKPMALRWELKRALLVFALLNALLFLVNFFDIKNVWFGFTFQGQFLRELVHEGTYLLIFSILLGMGICLYFFRGNLNFYKQNKGLKILAIVWVVQNMILVVSVFVRNYWYIHHYALAYKRIGVIFFLILTLVALVALLVKIIHRKKLSFMGHIQGWAFYGVMVGCCFVNWDVFIARYNINHADSAFLHLDYLAQMSSNALPVLDITEKELTKIKDSQPSFFELGSDFHRRYNYMTTEGFCETIRQKKNAFHYDCPSDWRSWNYADYRVKKYLESSQNE